MCGIIGFYTREACSLTQLNIIYDLILQSKIRGLHSFGISYFSNEKIITEKTFNVPNIHFLDNFYNSGSNIFIAHNHYSTSGNWHDMKNNQPIQISDNISVAMDGVLSMKPREEYEKEFNVSCITDNDTEILARKIENREDIEIFSKQIIGSLAAVYIKDKDIFAIRNNKRPLHIFIYGNATFVISTVDIVDRALKHEISIQSIRPNKLIKLCVI